MLLSEINSCDKNAYFLDIMQGEQFPFTVTADNDLDLSNSTAEFIVKDKIGGTLIFSLTTANGGLEITGQEILMNFSVSNTANIGDYVCQFTFTDSVTDIIVKSKIGNFKINPSL